MPYHTGMKKKKKKKMKVVASMKTIKMKVVVDRTRKNKKKQFS